MDIATSVGLLGVGANVIWPLIKQRKALLVGQVIACVFMFTHFFLLQAYTGAAVMLVAGIQAALAIPLEQHPQFKRIYLLSMLLTPIVCWISWHGIPSVFSSLALVLFCIGNLQTNTLRLRIFLLLCLFGWIGHNLLILSFPALLSNGLALMTSVFGLMREYKARDQRITADA